MHLRLMDAHITRQRKQGVHFSTRPFHQHDEVNPDIYKKTIGDAHCKQADRGTTCEGRFESIEEITDIMNSPNE